jgi:geranylgeranyl pyrophosphate synthase
MEGHLGTGREVSLQDYLTIASKKTASLFGLATAVAAYYCASDKGDIEKLRKFGIHTGILFQMVDDILDIAADRSMLGKPGGIDLRQKVPTLVNVLWSQMEPEKASKFFAQSEHSDKQVEETRKYLMKSEVLDQAMQHIKIQYQTAKDLLDNLGSPEVDPTIKAKLVELLDYTVDRIPADPA